MAPHAGGIRKAARDAVCLAWYLDHQSWDTLEQWVYRFTLLKNDQ